jgi:hypothetical protein
LGKFTRIYLDLEKNELGRKAFNRKGDPINFRAGAEIEISSSLIRVKSDRRSNRPHPKPINFSNTSHQNFDMAVLFSIVEWSST